MDNLRTLRARGIDDILHHPLELLGKSIKKQEVIILRFFQNISLLGLLILMLTACGIDAVQPVVPTPIPQGEEPLSQPQAEHLSANGILHPISIRTLSFDTGSYVKVLNIEVGMFVRAGQTLVVLDDTELQRAVVSAEMDLNFTRQKNNELQSRAVPVQERVVAATAAISSAQIALTQALAMADLQSNQDILDSAALNQAARALRDAQSAYDQLLMSSITKDWAPYSPAAKALEDAEEHYRLTLAEYRLHSADRGYDVAIANAESQLARAYLELYDAQHPVSMDALALAQMDVARAELALTTAKSNLTGTELKAPFDGLISAIHIDVGEWAQPGVPVVEMQDVSRWRVETRNVGELQIGRVRVGQKVNARVNAFRNDVLSGHVVTISPVAVVQQGDTTYTLIIELEPTTLNLRSGMTVQVEILIEE